MADINTPKNIVDNAPAKPAEAVVEKAVKAEAKAEFVQTELEAGAESNRARLAEILAKVDSVETAKTEKKGDTKVKLKVDYDYFGISYTNGSEVLIDKVSAEYLVANKLAEKL